MDEFEIIVNRALSGTLKDDDIANLAERLADSGARLEPRNANADLASTGGPGSLSTIWGPAALVALGRLVPKLGVPGRPAGGVDVLAQVPGYRVDLNAAAARQVLERCGYAHVQAGSAFAPADAGLFAYRQRAGAQAVSTLAIASLLSKKLAMGIRTVGLEVRVAPHGNFGTTESEAHDAARRFCRVAELLKLDATCFLTNGERPQQPYLGRGEALLAVSLLFSGRASSWLSRHAAACEGWAATLASTPSPSRLALAHAFAANIEAQGGSVDGLEGVAARVANAHDRVVTATKCGVVSYDLGLLRDAIIKTRGIDDDKFDDSAGVILLVEPGLTVRQGDPLLTARCPDRDWPSFQRMLLGAVRLADPADPASPATLAGTLEVIRVGSR